MSDQEAGSPSSAPTGRYLLVLSLGALGVVYGDIGTSPLYALRECFHGPHAIAPTPQNVLGVLSLIFWTLFVVISVKYLAIVLRADNRGEGGILALMSLLRPQRGDGRGARWALSAMGLFGAALLYGDGIITPAISVLSAVEGLQIAAPSLGGWVIPITVVILVVLFLLQKRGTAGVGAVFGPVMLVWFVALGALGLYQMFTAPRVFLALNPAYAWSFFVSNGWHGFLTLGAVFLVTTGGEALYADMGHFGRHPIRLVWFSLVLPGLVLNYFGQGALLLRSPGAAANPFYLLAPPWALYPLVGLSTLATVIASQAVISGAFSLTRQAVQLGYTPRMLVHHTSAREIGQIYIPAINWLLMLSCVFLVLAFKTSSGLAAAYGVAVTTTMAITTILLAMVEVEIWGWRKRVVVPLTLFFLVIDLAFFGANILKVMQGGWFPLFVAAVIFTLMSTWKRGRQILADRLKSVTLPVESFLASIKSTPPTRVRGTAIFMDRLPEGTPPPLLHNLKHNKILHERIILMTVTTEEIPHVPVKERIGVERLAPDFYRITIVYGFQDTPDLPEVLKDMKLDGKPFNLMDTTFFLGRETLIASRHPGMALWREKLFAWMSRAEGRATTFFGIPPNRVVELGMQVEL